MAKKAATRKKGKDPRVEKDAAMIDAEQRKAQEELEAQEQYEADMMREEEERRKHRQQVLQETDGNSHVQLDMREVVVEYIDPSRNDRVYPVRMTVGEKMVEFGTDQEDGYGKWEGAVPAYWAQKMITMYPESWAFVNRKPVKKPEVEIPANALTGNEVEQPAPRKQEIPAKDIPPDNGPADLSDAEREEKYPGVPKIRTKKQANDFIAAARLKQEAPIIRRYVTTYEKKPTAKTAESIDRYIHKIMGGKKSDAKQRKATKQTEVRKDADI